MAQMVSAGGGGGDPRLSLGDEKLGGFADEPLRVSIAPDGSGAYTRPQFRRLHDPSVTFEEYYYYAQKTRVEEDQQVMGEAEVGLLSLLLPSKKAAGVQLKAVDKADSENDGSPDANAGGKRPSLVHKTINLSKQANRLEISDEEWTNASRALRTASWGAIFYLITTDILGPFGLPYAFTSLGWGPGVVLYTVFAGLAIYSGYLLHQVFMGLDSYEFPIKNFGDLGYRLYGKWVRWGFNLLQSVQLLLNVGLIVISNGEALSQAAKFNLCFAVCCLVWAIAGWLFGQVRTLQKFGWLANLAVWLNLMCMFITMGAAAHSHPNYAAASQSAGANLQGGALVTPNAQGVFPPVQTSGGNPDSSSFIGSLNGAMQAVFAFGGSMIFPELMSEMKRPRDFLKGMFFAQLFIYLCYMLYGLFMYAYEGQYTVNPSYLGIAPYGVQTAGNVFAMVSALIAAALYGNIGVKVIYNNIFAEWFSFPALTTKAGKIIWAIVVPIYWIIAFVIAAAIPNFSGLTGVVAALCILNFTYTFPPMLSIAYLCRLNTMHADSFDPQTGTTNADSAISRLTKGFMRGRWYQNVFNLIYMLGALALCGLGSYASITILKDAFAKNSTNSFVCTSPLEG